MQLDTNDIVFICHQTFKKLKFMSNFQNQRMQFNTNDIVYINHQTFKKLKSITISKTKECNSTHDIVYINHQTFKKLKSMSNFQNQRMQFNTNDIVVIFSDEKKPSEDFDECFST